MPVSLVSFNDYLHAFKIVNFYVIRFPDRLDELEALWCLTEYVGQIQEFCVHRLLLGSVYVEHFLFDLGLRPPYFREECAVLTHCRTLLFDRLRDRVLRRVALKAVFTVF